MTKHLLNIILIISLSGFSSFAQNIGYSVDWDLSYEKLLNQNGVKWDHSQGTLFTWLKHREQEHQFIAEFVRNELKKEPQQVFLIDHPTFPSAGRTTILGVKNDQGCFYYWRSTDENMRDFRRRPISNELFSQVFNRLNTLKQRGFQNMGGPEKAYAGFLSTYQNGQARQLLLHIHDFLEFDVENQEILRVGRISEIESSLQVNNKQPVNH
ncbi:MAG: hypothetical protein DHS20C17_25450 [Cyclobacteriaceae bacterium]|nr:MAG: hypothetical protein DHS20C17_25450 [Cyclobacteriaceae bacterium]